MALVDLEQTTARKDYNYERFTSGFFDLRRFPGPRTGEPFPSIEVIDIDAGETILPDEDPHWLVLETASCTCPMYARHVRSMAELAVAHREVEFVLLYVREAHPGERTPGHKTMSEKIDRARSLRRLYGEGRRIVVDHLSGEGHRQIGFMPNCVYLISPEAKVAYRSDWAIATDLRSVLEHREALPTRGEHVEPFLRWPWPSPFVLGRGGWQAVWDLVRHAPALAANHWRAEREYRRYGRLRD